MPNSPRCLLPFVVVLVFLIVVLPGTAQQADPVAEATRGMTVLPGFFNLYWDDDDGKLWMLVDKWDTEFLYVNSMPAGVGSNDIGLDRGQLGGQRIVFFRKVGKKVLLMQPNYSYRAESSDPAERAAVAQSFAQAVLWGFTAEKQTEGKALVDVTAFALRDAHGIANRLRAMKQGEYRQDASRSAIYLDRTKSFPKNTEIEALVTFATDRQAGGLLRTVTPSTSEFTVRLHHSFVELPDDNYKPRAFDPRSSFGAVSYFDYAVPIEAKIERRWIPRHRLEKKNPGATVSEAVEPIVYYVDRGAPEPIRTALIEGASWWNEAFEAIGYKDAFRVEVMPEGADPMDVRYNVIQWVHRSTRGWSYGASVRDPRTGEIIKGHVTLGSLRVRQDYLIAKGLLAPFEEGKPSPPHMRELALARLRQLSAHEVGHTLGLAHNFAASLDGDASVMDYPHPFVALGEEDSVDISKAYATGMGAWDKVSIAYGYQHFSAGADEQAALGRILDDAFSRGLRYITDRDSRPLGGASPDGHLWDTGADPVTELRRLSKVRNRALSRFSPNVIEAGEPLAALGEVLVPVYLLHRYQTEAAAKVVGGLDYTYALRPAAGAAAMATIVPRQRQMEALEALLSTLQPDFLRLPEPLLRQVPPHPPGYDRTRESFPARTGLTFDPLAAAEVSADHTASLLLHPERAARLVEYSAREQGQLSLPEVLDALLGASFRADAATGFDAELQRTVNAVVLYRLMALAAAKASTPQVKALAMQKLSELRHYLLFPPTANNDPAWRAHHRWATDRIERFMREPESIPLAQPQEAPPGQPIGCGEMPLFAGQEAAAYLGEGLPR